MEPWVRKKGLIKRGAFVTQLTAPEWDLIVKLVEEVGGQIVARQDSAPTDELAELTGLKVGHSEPPTEDGLSVLLPNFEREEYTDGENAVLRQLHEPDILDAKFNHLAVLSQAVLTPAKTVRIQTEQGATHLLTIEVPFDQAPQVVAALNDLRLYLAADRILDYDPEAEARHEEEGYGGPHDQYEPREDYDPEDTFCEYPKQMVVEFLGFCQDSLLRAMMGDDLP